MSTKDKRNIKANVPNLRFPEFEREWKTRKIKDVMQLISGGTPFMQCPQYWGGDIPLISAISMHQTYISSSSQYITEVGLKNGSKLLPKNNLMLLVRGSMLWNRIPICYNLIDVAFNQDVKGLIPNSKSTSSFALYWFQSKETLLKNMVTGTGIGAGKLDTDNISSLPIDLPNIDEQIKITTFFSSLDQRIETQSQIIEELKSIKRILRNNLYRQLAESGRVEKITNLLDYEQPTNYIVTDTNYSDDHSLTPVLTANKAFVLGYINEDFGVYNKGECIIFDDFTMDLKYVDFPFKVKSSAIKILTAKQGVNLRFIYEYLSFLKLTSTDHKRHYISEIEQMKIIVPKIEIQNNIANILWVLDQKIDIETKQYDSLMKQKKYLLGNMFI